MKRVCFISTVNHNVGDDFVREGICDLLRDVIGEFRADIVHKHFPATVRGGLWPVLDRMTRQIPNHVAWRERVSRMVDALSGTAAKDKLLNSDLIVQAGTPMYWKNAWSTCARTEWFDLLIERRWRRVGRAIPLWNLGAGSCQPWGSDGSEVVADEGCRAYIDRFTSLCSVTTVRDSLACEIVRQCGHEVPVLPCPSIFVTASPGLNRGTAEYLALNYMPGGGHYEWAGSGKEDARQWEACFSETVRRLARSHPCLMICHDRREVAAAQRLFPEIPRFHSRDWRAYVQVYSRCRAAIVSRVHGAVVAAAMGKRVLLVGNDTRLLTAAQVPGIIWMPVVAARQGIHDQVQELLGQPMLEDTASFLESTRQRYLTLLRAAHNSV
ncbi:MAG: polysaccharide pyruvyl transferase family protein [Verrucomicrobiaceae bacterium]|jgi:diadenosine tetraphosphatase ApaH/serine/threonine PP2A family protein phosphatase|nr:polysaccharide pyruvyl transferase family protein [Verrucomicrobiaceae bacterium]